MIGKGKMTCYLVTNGTLRHPITLPLQIKRPWHPSGTRDVPQFGVGDVGHDADETRLASQTGNGREDHVNGTASHFGGPSGKRVVKWSIVRRWQLPPQWRRRSFLL